MQPRGVRYLLEATFDDRMGVERRAKAFVFAMVFTASAIFVPAAIAEAPSLFALPWSEALPDLSGKAPHVEAVALGRPDERAKSLSAIRRSSRSNGERRGRAMLHRAVDDALAQTMASPRIAAAVHEAIESSARAAAIRPLVDGAALVIVRMSRATLREAAPGEGFPWSE